MSTRDHGATRGDILGSATTRVRRPPEEGRSAEAHLKDHYETLSKQTHGAQFGMWVFIASETAMFSALFALFTAYRTAFPEAFKEGARETVLWMGSAGTATLLLASFLVAAALALVRSDRTRAAAAALLGAAGLGALFLVFKFWEWGIHFGEGIFPGTHYHFEKLPPPGGSAFFTLYYVMTGLHALHVIGGILLLTGLAWRTHRRAYGPEYDTPVELGGMYWHFVDIVWLFLWPCFYLIH